MYFHSFFLHSLSVTTYPFAGLRGVWSQSQPTLGEGGGSPWTNRQFFARLIYRDKQPLMLTFTPTGRLESPVDLHVFERWVEAGVLRETHADTRRTCKLHTERSYHSRVSNPRSSCCVATVLTTKPPCHHNNVLLIKYLNEQRVYHVC